MSSLPPAVHPHLEKQLDWDNEVDADLVELAHYMHDWDSTLAAHLKLTETDTNAINRTYSVDTLLQRYNTTKIE